MNILALITFKLSPAGMEPGEWRFAFDSKNGGMVCSFFSQASGALANLEFQDSSRLGH